MHEYKLWCTFGCKHIFAKLKAEPEFRFSELDINSVYLFRFPVSKKKASEQPYNELWALPEY
jgi:hypothetical protein